MKDSIATINAEQELRALSVLRRWYAVMRLPDVPMTTIIREQAALLEACRELWP